MKIKTKFAIGDKLKDRISGFVGIATGYCKYVTGCGQYCLVPESKDGTKKEEGAWIDEGRLEFVEHTEFSMGKYKYSDDEEGFGQIPTTGKRDETR